MAAETRDPAAKVLTVFTYLAESDKSWGVRELARQLDMTPSTCLRALTLLCDTGLVEQDESTKRFDLSGAALRLAHHIQRRHSLAQRVTPLLETITETTGEAALLALVDWSQVQLMFVAATEPTHPLRYVVPLYEWGPLSTGASGLAALAYGPESAVQTALNGVPESELAEIRSQLALARAQGFVSTHGRRISGAVGVSAPILGPDGIAKGTITISVPETRFKDIQFNVLADAVVTAARTATSFSGGPTPSHR